MDVLELIKKRRTIQSFTNDEVSSALIRASIEAAIHAPNHKLTWPWLFVEVEKATREKLAALHAELKARKAGAPLSPIEQTAVVKKFMEPGVLIIAAMKKSGNPSQEEEDYASLACAVQNMSLYLWNEGVGTKWGTGALIKDARTYEILGLKTSEHKICGLIWVGKARQIPLEPKRPPLEQFLVRR